VVTGAEERQGVKRGAGEPMLVDRLGERGKKSKGVNRGIIKKVPHNGED